VSDLVERGAQLYARIQVEDVGQLLRRLLFFFFKAGVSLCTFLLEKQAGELARCSNPGRGCWSALAPSLVVEQQELRQ
jgi:hypothetical protein